MTLDSCKKSHGIAAWPEEERPRERLLNRGPQIFERDAVLYADAVKDQNWEVRFPLDQLGENLMAVFIDIYGNEARVLIEAEQFGRAPKNGGKVEAADRSTKKATRKKTKAS